MFFQNIKKAVDFQWSYHLLSAAFATRVSQEEHDAHEGEPKYNC
jgi:hypothetical protein